jgi:Uma2 family endonuclease
MTLAIDTEIELVSDDNHLVLEGVSWETYESLLRDFEATGQRKRVTYDDGRMVIVSPLFKHELWKSLLGQFVEAICDQRDIPIITAGSTTWKRKRKKKGLEPDECFYIQHEKVMRGRLEVDLKKDPPPDLAIEVDLRAYLMNKLNVYAGLGIPEAWGYDGFELGMFVLQKNGEYQQVNRSAALPFLTPADLKRFLDLFTQMDQNSILRAVSKWAKELPNLLPWSLLPQHFA